MKTIIFAAILSLNLNSYAKENKKLINTNESTVSWLGKKKITGDKHYGKINVKKGEIIFDSKGQPKEAEIVIDMKSITNEDLKDKKYNKKLVGHLSNEDFFDVNQFPISNLKISKFSKTKIDKKSDDKNANTFKAVGELKIKDKTEQVGFDVLVSKVGNTHKGTGKLIIDRTRWDIRYGSDSFFKGLGDKVIADEIELNFEIQTLD